MRWNRPATLLLVGLLLLFAAGPAAGDRTLVGEWMLVEQTYGKGGANLLRENAPSVRLEFFREGAEIRGRIFAGREDVKGVTWPRISPDVARTIHVEEQIVSQAEGLVRARYRIAPSPGDDLVLIVTEEYTVAEEGQALLGRVHVEFGRDGEERGSYTLRRRLERVR